MEESEASLGITAGSAMLRVFFRNLGCFHHGGEVPRVGPAAAENSERTINGRLIRSPVLGTNIGKGSSTKL